MINEFHDELGNLRCIFPNSFVDHMRIPRAVEVKMVESVNALPEVNRQDYTYYCENFEETNASDDTDLELRDDSLRIEPCARAMPSRDHSFRYLTTAESRSETMYREKLMVSELRQKLKNHRKIDEND